MNKENCISVMQWKKENDLKKINRHQNSPHIS